MDFVNNIEALLTKLGDSIKTDTVIGEPITIGTKTIIPITNLKYGFGFSNSSTLTKSNNNFSAGGAKVEPIGFLIVDEDGVEVISLDQKETLFDKIIDTKNYDKVVKFLDKFKNQGKRKKSKPNNIEKNTDINEKNNNENIKNNDNE